jgi:hypothetical protein
MAMDWTFYIMSLITEGSTEKALQFIMPLQSLYIKNVGFKYQKCRKVKTKIIFKIKLILFIQNVLFTISELPSVSLFWYYIKLRCSIKSSLSLRHVYMARFFQ